MSSGGEGAVVTDGRPVSQELAALVADLRYEDLPDGVTEEAGRALVDFLGETLFVGGTQDLGKEVGRFAAINGGGQPEATIIANGQKTLVSRAAFANGTMALGFEYGDWASGSRGYPFAVPGPFALAEFRRFSGRQLALAITIGYEVLGRLFYSMHPGRATSHYTPALYGTLASGAACGRLLDLDADRMTKAVGLAAAFTGGSFQGHEEGAWQRCLNGGIAAERGVTAALMSEFGYDGAKFFLEGVQGFATQYGNATIKEDKLLGGWGENWYIADRWTKAYPMNTTLHAPYECLLKIITDNGIAPDEIETITAHWQKVEPFLAKNKVTRVVSAQASLPFALSLAAVKGQITVDLFTDETVNDPAIQAMIQRVSVTQDLELYKKVGDKKTFPGKVTLRTKDGREFTEEKLFPRGNPSNLLSPAEFKAKFMDQAERVLGKDRSEELYERALGLRDLPDVSVLAPLLSGK